MRLTLRQRWKLRESALRSRAIDRAVHGLVRVRQILFDGRPSRGNIEVKRDIAYGPTDGRDHKLDVYVPTRAARPLPIVMYVHGGGFAMLSKDTHRVMAIAFARRGYLVFNINYRMGQKNPFPAPLEDAATALQWVHRHAVEYGGDPERIAIAGESAGGNLVAALAIANASRRPEPFLERMYDANINLRATISTYPFADVAEIDSMLENPRYPQWLKSQLFDAASAYLGSGVFRAADASHLASPLLVLENGFAPTRPLTPFFLSVGTRDPLLSQSRRLKAALDRLGTECELLVSPGEIHGFDAMYWRHAAQQKWSSAHSFLAKHV
jgi:acetyl esterase